MRDVWRARLRALLETLPRVLVGSTGPPLGAAPFGNHLLTLGCRRLLRGFPQPPAREPLHYHIFTRAPELVKRRQQLLLLARAERGRLAVDEDGPVRVARRHGSILARIWGWGFGIRYDPAA